MAPAAPVEPQIIAPVNVPLAESPPPAAEPQTDTAPADAGVPVEALLAALFGLVVLGGAGFAAAGMRRRRGREVFEPDFDDRTFDPAPVAPVSADQEGRPIPVALSSAHIPTPPVPAHSALGDDAPVPTGEERRRLVEQMAAASPDEANPFKSYPARRKRARIILQAREHRQRQQADASFDWRTYRSSTSTDPASSPLVDA